MTVGSRAVTSGGSSTSCERCVRGYSKGLDGGSQLRVRINSAERITQLREIVEEFFLAEEASVR